MYKYETCWRWHHSQESVEILHMMSFCLILISGSMSCCVSLHSSFVEGVRIVAVGLLWEIYFVGRTVVSLRLGVWKRLAVSVGSANAQRDGRRRTAVGAGSTKEQRRTTSGRQGTTEPRKTTGLQWTMEP